MPSSIYALYDPDSPEHVRYVGRTRRTPEQRLQQHVYVTNRGMLDTHATRWIRTLIGQGRLPGVRLLEVTSQESEDDRERHWIAAMRSAGHDLTNGTDGGGGVVMTNEVRAAHRVRMARVAAEHPEWPELRRRVALDRWSDPVERERWLAALHASPAYRDRGRLTAEWWKDPTYRAAAGGPHDQATKDRMSETHLRRCADPLVREERLRTVYRGPRDRCREGHPLVGDNVVVSKNGSRHCRTCDDARAARRAQAKAEGVPLVPATELRTHCFHGHEYTPENTAIDRRGWKRCRECNRAAVRATKARKRAATSKDDGPPEEC